MSVNSVTPGLKFKPSLPPLLLCLSSSLSPFRFLLQTLHLYPRPPPSLCSLSFTAFKVHWMRCWYSVVFFRLAYSKPSAPGSQHSFSVFVKNFSVSMHHRQTVQFISRTHLQCLNGKFNDGICGKAKTGNPTVSQSLHIFCSLSLKYSILAIQLIYTRLYILRYLCKA